MSLTKLLILLGILGTSVSAVVCRAEQSHWGWFNRFDHDDHPKYADFDKDHDHDHDHDRDGDHDKDRDHDKDDCGGVASGSHVPEISAVGFSSMACIVVGGVMLITSRRRESSLILQADRAQGNQVL